MLLLISRFMAWKMATSFVLTAETWLGRGLRRSGADALLAVGVSCLGVMQRFKRAQVVTFAPVEWLKPEQVDDTYFKILPTGRSEITAGEARRHLRQGRGLGGGAVELASSHQRNRFSCNSMACERGLQHLNHGGMTL